MKKTHLKEKIFSVNLLGSKIDYGGQESLLIMQSDIYVCDFIYLISI